MSMARAAMGRFKERFAMSCRFVARTAFDCSRTDAEILGFDLLDHLINPDPQERLSMAGVLKHSWMKAHQPMHHPLEFPP
jgi:serine/threonine protein kinase